MKRLLFAALVGAAALGLMPSAQATIVICDNVPVFVNCFDCTSGTCRYCRVWVVGECINPR